MVIDLSFISEENFLFWSIIFSCIFLVISLSLIERKLSKKLEVEKDKVRVFQEKISALKKANEKPEQLFFLLDELAKDFFRETYNLDMSLPYYERINLFSKTGNVYAKKFCEIMEEAMYSGEAMSQSKIQFLLKSFENYVEEEKKSLALKSTKKDLISRVPFLAIFRRFGKKNKDNSYLVYREKGPVLENLEIKTKSKEEKKVHDYIHSVDNLNRIEKKIKERKPIQKYKASLF